MKSDVQLLRDVLDELDFDPSVSAAQIAATVQDGVVTLTGQVAVFSEKLAAEKVARRVHGVKAVANDIEVRPPECHLRDDASLAAAAVHALDWNTRVPAGRVQVVVRQGNVFLEGTVDQRFQREAAEETVRHLRGIRHVTNHIRIAPNEMDDDLLRAIQAALKRSATVNSQRIQVEAQGHQVVLTGDVHSYAEMEDAERAAWSARGVREVVNCLTITPWGDGPADEWGY